MHVTVEVVGEGSHDLEIEDATYADLLAEVDLSPHEVSVLVDGSPVPEDSAVATDHVKVLRLIKGGSGDGSERGSGTDDDGGDGNERASRIEGDDTESDIWTGNLELGVSELDFELPNAGTGPDPLRLSELAAVPENEAVVLLFHRDYRCRNCREQIQAVGDRYGEFRDRDAVVVSVLPEPRERAEKWQKQYHLPFPLVADEDKTVAVQYGQPTRWGKLGGLHDLLGRLPEIAILDARDGLELYAVHRGDGPGDRPEIDEVLRMVDQVLGADEMLAE